MSKNVKRGLFVHLFGLTLLSAWSLSAGTAPTRGTGQSVGADGIQHVLLISIDGMHAFDFINCAKGISGANGGAPYCPHLADLKKTGIDYLYAYTSEPSDSFPGLMAPCDRCVSADAWCVLRRCLRSITRSAGGHNRQRPGG
jgi:hypothetical protein